MTRREIIDRVSEHLTEQGRRCVWSGAIRFRAPDGTASPIGCLLPDEAYSRDFEGMDLEHAATLPREFQGKRMRRFLGALEDAGLLRHLDLLITLEGVHMARKPAEWPKVLEQMRRD